MCRAPTSLHVTWSGGFRSSAASTSSCWPSSNATPSGFHSLIPLYGAGLCDAVITAPHLYSFAPRARVGVLTIPASVASAPEARTPAISAEASISPERRGSRPTMVAPNADPRTRPTARARSAVTSTFAIPRIPEEPNSRTTGQSSAFSKPFPIHRGEPLRLPEMRLSSESLYRNPRIRRPSARAASRREPHGDGADQRRGREGEGPQGGPQAGPREGDGRGDPVHEGPEQPDRGHHLGAVHGRPDEEEPPGLRVERLHENHEEGVGRGGLRSRACERAPLEGGAAARI